MENARIVLQELTQSTVQRMLVDTAILNINTNTQTMIWGILLLVKTGMFFVMVWSHQYPKAIAILGKNIIQIGIRIKRKEGASQIQDLRMTDLLTKVAFVTLDQMMTRKFSSLFLKDFILTLARHLYPGFHPDPICQCSFMQPFQKHSKVLVFWQAVLTHSEDI